MNKTLFSDNEKTKISLNSKEIYKRPKYKGLNNRIIFNKDTFVKSSFRQFDQEFFNLPSERQEPRLKPKENPMKSHGRKCFSLDFNQLERRKNTKEEKMIDEIRKAIKDNTILKKGCPVFYKRIVGKEEEMKKEEVTTRRRSLLLPIEKDQKDEKEGKEKDGFEYNFLKKHIQIKSNKDNSNSNNIYKSNTNQVKDSKDTKKQEKILSKRSSTYTFNIIKKFKDTLIRILSFLYFNKVPIRQFHSRNPFNSLPFKSSKSNLFFEKIKLNDLDYVSLLLKYDNSLLFEFDYFGQSPFHWAAKRNYVSLLNLLLKFGSPINTFDHLKRTPLHLACLNEHVESIMVLLENEANPFFLDKFNNRPIDLTNNKKCVTVLLEYQDKYAVFNTRQFFKKKVIRYHKDN